MQIMASKDTRLIGDKVFTGEVFDVLGRTGRRIDIVVADVHSVGHGIGNNYYQISPEKFRACFKTT